jgi:SAM-dependent methyltransferase
LEYHRRRGCEAQGIDPDANVLRAAERFGLNARAGLFRADDFPKDYFDYVTLDQVIEHTVDPARILRDAAEILRPGGTILIATPNVRSLSARLLGCRWCHWHTPYHLQLFSEKSLRRLVQEVGLEILWIRYITNPRWYSFQWLHLISRPSMGHSSKFWAASCDWPIGLRILRKGIEAMGRLGIHHLTAISLDTLNLGDNMVVAVRRSR